MKNQVVQFQVSSPDELREALAIKTSNNSARFAAVRVFGPEIITRHFELPQMSAADLFSGLMLEASQIFSAKQDEIELCYQVLSADNGHVKGVFSAMLQKRLVAYLDCFKDSKLVPVSLVSSAVGAVGDFVKKNPAAGRDYFLVNFLSAHAADVVVVMEGEPALFREVNEPTDADIEKKVVDCVRYCCSRSSSKSLESVYFLGDLTGKEYLMQRLKGIIYANPSQGEIAWTPWKVDIARLNLFSGYALGEGERNLVAQVLTAVTIAACVLFSFVAWKAHLANNQLQQAKSTYSESDYKLALDLKDQILHFAR